VSTADDQHDRMTKATIAVVVQITRRMQFSS
jgi:hypothetical protein